MFWGFPFLEARICEIPPPHQSQNWAEAAHKPLTVRGVTRPDNRMVRFTCDFSNGEQSLLFAEKHFGIPPTVKSSHALNSSTPGMSSIPLILAHTWLGPGLQNAICIFQNAQLPTFFVVLLSICQTPLTCLGTFVHRHPRSKMGALQNNFNQTRTL